MGSKVSFQTFVFLGILVLFAMTSCATLGLKEDTMEKWKLERESLSIKGIERTYLVHKPKNRTIVHPAVLMVLHGRTGTAEGMVSLAKGEWNELSDLNGFYVVYPQGLRNEWNDERVVSRDAKPIGDDVLFFQKLIQKLRNDYGIDSSRVYVTGLSNGAIMSHTLGCKLSRSIAGIAPVAGNFPIDILSQCRIKRPIRVLLVNGTEDTIVPYQGGLIHTNGKDRGKVASADRTFEIWRSLDACSAGRYYKRSLDRDSSDSTTIQMITYPDCKRNSEVRLYKVKGGGHTWPGGKQYYYPSVIGRTSQDMSTAWEICKFFKLCRLSNPVKD